MRLIYNISVKKNILILVIFVAVISLYLFLKPVMAPSRFFNAEQKVNISQVEIAGKNIKVELANTDTTRELGLSGHKPLADDEGMLFIFDKPGIYPFWMKDMLFPIDIVWISSSFKVIYVGKNLQPSSYPQTFGPNENSMYVLEVNSNFSEKNNLKIGDEVKF